jgi:hypothetical protein
MQPQSDQDKMLLEYLMANGMLSPEEEMLQRREGRLAKMRDTSKLNPGQMIGNRFVGPSGLDAGLNVLTQGINEYHQNKLETEQEALARKRQEAFKAFADRAAGTTGAPLAARGWGGMDTADYGGGM